MKIEAKQRLIATDAGTADQLATALVAAWHKLMPKSSAQISGYKEERTVTFYFSKDKSELPYYQQRNDALKLMIDINPKGNDTFEVAGKGFIDTKPVEEHLALSHESLGSTLSATGDYAKCLSAATNFLAHVKARLVQLIKEDRMLTYAPYDVENTFTWQEKVGM